MSIAKGPMAQSSPSTSAKRSIVAVIATTILVSIVQRSELKDERSDERDRLVNGKAMRNGYFALRDSNGNLANQFITVANMVNEDGGVRVIAGNERVVRARLSDGEFYWEQDKKVKLEDWGKKLSDVVFHAKVGMMDAKVARIEKLALEIAEAVGFADTNAVKRAALLCKADLTSGMVGEFPELQGIMGRYYALAQGESAEIADAIRDHYKPVGAGDSLPESDLAAIIANCIAFCCRRKTNWLERPAGASPCRAWGIADTALEALEPRYSLLYIRRDCRILQ
ncbi:MAG: hypothetical protein B7X02_03250 [Rhodospirillales bacterium 12-54-5]|nr:MAG: hypothetical protein B7X02_03250 [Rhodospirillales bacterium 12-54-5]